MIDGLQSNASGYLQRSRTGQYDSDNGEKTVQTWAVFLLCARIILVGRFGLARPATLMWQGRLLSLAGVLSQSSVHKLMYNIFPAFIAAYNFSASKLFSNAAVIENLALPFSVTGNTFSSLRPPTM